MLQENILFANRYQLIKLLGRGGFSEVWLAKDNYTHLEIAIKVYAPGQGMDQDGLKDFCGELASVYDLNHSNLLKPQHVDTCENMPYLIMAYCPAGSCLKRVGKMTEVELWKLIRDVASGLAYLHDKGVIHQDIKPDNILVDTEGNFLITDFGISTRARSTLRKSVIGGNTSGGTTAYMGPERFSRQPAPTKASDIWSFGAMAFELLEGVTPFGEIGGGMQKGGAEIPFINTPTSDALKFVIFKMLSKETWDRPTASTLVEWATNPSAIQIDYSLLNPEETLPVSSPQSQSTPITNTTNEITQTEGRATQRFGSVEQRESGNETISYHSELKEKEPILVLGNENRNEKIKKRNTSFIWILMILVMVVGSGIALYQARKEQTRRDDILISYNHVIEKIDNFLNIGGVNNIDVLLEARKCVGLLKKYESQNNFIEIKSNKYSEKVEQKCTETYHALINEGNNYLYTLNDQNEAEIFVMVYDFYNKAYVLYPSEDLKEVRDSYLNTNNKSESVNLTNEIYKQPVSAKKKCPKEIELLAKPNRLDFENYGGNKTLTIESSSEYTITSTTPWITIDKIKNNSKSVFVILGKNNSSLERSGYLMVTNKDGKNIRILVTQKGNISK